MDNGSGEVNGDQVLGVEFAINAEVHLYEKIIGK